ncbi:MAG: amidohydrolase family protein [Anaerolineales bacterium]
MSDDKITAYLGAMLIDGTGAAPLDDSVIIVQDEKITAVGRSEVVEIPPKAEQIDLTGKTVIPGLIDAHTHFFGVMNMDLATFMIDPSHQRAIRAVMEAWRVVDAGFTTVRDPAGMLGIYLKQVIKEGSIVGPRILASGLALSQTAGHGDFPFVPKEMVKTGILSRIADGVEEVRRASREQLRAGADFLKIMTTGGVISDDDPEACQFSLDEIRAFVEVAQNARVRTAAHAQGLQGIKNALIAGVDSIEHGFYLDDECIEMMLNQGTYLVPTFAAIEAIIAHGRKSETATEEQYVRKAEKAQEAHVESFKKAFKAGVTCGLGSDYPCDPFAPMGTNAAELEIYVNKVGLSPMDTIVCATKNNAQVLGLERELGTLEVGKLADLLVVSGNPLDDISILRDKAKIDTVLKAGKPIPRLPLS